MGHAEVVNKSDGEPAIKALKKKAAEDVGIVSIPEESVPYGSKSNSEIACAVKELKGMIRATKIALEANLGLQLERTDPMLAWIPTYAADMISRHRVATDGNTAERRRTGRHWRRPTFEYGELIFYKVVVSKVKKKRGGYDAVMKEGRYLGRHGRTGALLVMTAEGAQRGS